MKTGRKLPVGIQGFEGLRNDGYLYVDKTEYIYQLVHREKERIGKERIGKERIGDTGSERTGENHGREQRKEC